MHPFERMVLKRKGYIPDNVQAMRDYTNGKISQVEMWRIINSNIKIDAGKHILRTGNWATPRRKDLVWFDPGEITERHGVIVDIDYDGDGPKEVYVDFRDGEQVCFDASDFNQHTSKGATTWLIFAR